MPEQSMQQLVMKPLKEEQSGRQRGGAAAACRLGKFEEVASLPRSRRLCDVDTQQQSAGMDSQGKEGKKRRRMRKEERAKAAAAAAAAVEGEEEAAAAMDIDEFEVEQDDDEEDGRGRRSSSTRRCRLSSEQVKYLEMSFAALDGANVGGAAAAAAGKLEPTLKASIAAHLGLPPRHVAVWFQNRRARWKTTQLQHRFTSLTAQYDSLLAEKETALRQHHSAMDLNLELHAEVARLRAKLKLLHDSSCNDSQGIRETDRSKLTTSPTKSIRDGAQQSQRAAAENETIIREIELTTSPGTKSKIVAEHGAYQSPNVYTKAAAAEMDMASPPSNLCCKPCTSMDQEQEEPHYYYYYYFHHNSAASSAVVVDQMQQQQLENMVIHPYLFQQPLATDSLCVDEDVFFNWEDQAVGFT